MKKIIIYILITVAILLAILTRFYKLGTAPKGLYLDEAGQGYSAYSILKTGKDEFEKSFPIVFRSFNDFKTPVYIYLVAPLIPIFDLTAFTVRFPSFFFSILTIPLLYLLIKELFSANAEKFNLDKSKIELIAVISPLLLSISPWHILFGRTNFECNVALFFYLLGVYIFFKSLKKPKLLIASAISFAIAIPAYHSQRIVTPLTLIALFLMYRKTILDKKHLISFIIGAALGAIFSFPTIFIALTPGFLARASGLNIFSHERFLPAGSNLSYKGVFEWLINSSFLLSLKEFLSLYFSYLFPRNMFILGDYGPRSSFPQLSTFFLWQFPFYLYGIYLLIKDKTLGTLRWYTILLLLISPIPAAVTRDPYSTIRALPLVIPQTIIISIGLSDLIFRLKSSHMYIKFLLFGFSLIVILYSLGKLYSSVIILNEYYRANEWNYGWQETVGEIKKLNPKYSIVVDNARSEPYIQILFYLKFDPSTYQKDNASIPLNEYYTNMDRDPVIKIGNITTRTIDWKNDLAKKQYLIGDELAISLDQIKRENLTLIKEIKYPDGSCAFRIVETNPTYQ